MASLHVLVMPRGDFELDDRHYQLIRETLPDATLRIVPGDDATQEDVHWADIIFGWPRKSWVASAPWLRWVQLPSAGSDGWEGLRPDIMLTKASGVFGIPISEWVIGAILMLTRNLHLYRDQQAQRLWQVRPGAREIYGSTVGIVGLGDLGQEVARRAQALGCSVVGSRRTPGAPPPFVDALLPLDDLLPVVDFLVLALPNTAETAGLIFRTRLQRMRKGSYLINVGRGATVDEGALVEALQSGHLAGAALDVTAVEPLPPESPLWQMEQVVISPHASGRSPAANAARRMEIFCDNLRRFSAGESLRNLVDRTAGY